jgi:tRNA uridine 5-carbamoylmethylation protein Kti12
MLPGTKTPFQVVFIMCGLPASGKSTLAARIATLLREGALASQVRVLDIDSLRTTLYSASGAGSAFMAEREAEVRDGKLKEIDEALGKGHSVIDDDLNYFRSMRKEIADIACKHRVHYAIIHVDTPVKQCIAWNAGREHPVPLEVIKDIESKFDKPGSRSYSWDEPLITINLAKHMVDDALIDLRRRLDKVSILLQAKQHVVEMLGGSSSVLNNPAFWNLALLGRIVNDGFLVNDVQEWRDTIQGTSASVLDRFEVATRRAIGTHAARGDVLPSALLKEAKRFKQNAMKALKKDPARLDALIAEFDALLATKSE